MSEKKPHRTKRQKTLLIVNIVVAASCIIAGSGLLYANQRLGNRQVVSIDQANGDNGDNGNAPGSNEWNLPPGDLSARNYLITGTDSRGCIDPKSPFAGGFGDRTNFGERSDTIMVIRVNPLDDQALILSFPRDMWVKISGSTHKSRINSAFQRKDPNKLIRTIKDNFDINIDHYVNIDFCTFKDIVEAVGGVRVPFLYRTRDKGTGLNVPKPGCFTFTGDHALAYVRSRHYSYYDTVQKKWRTDALSDWGRISRQQDFTRRMVQRALEKGRTNPKIATQMLNTALKNVITDDKLTPMKLLQLAQAMKNYDPTTMSTYTMQAIGAKIGKESVLLPDLESSNMKDILSIFRGQASLKKAPPSTSSELSTDSTALETSFVVGTLSAISATYKVPTVVTTVSSTTSSTTTSTTIPEVDPTPNDRGVTPPADPSCH